MSTVTAEEREIYSDPSTPSTTTAATPHRGTTVDLTSSGIRDEYQAECEVQFEGGPDLETLASNCQKNPDHINFIPVQEFLRQEAGHLKPEDMDDVRAVVDRTVRVVVGKVSADRPDVYPGTSIPFPYRDCRGLKCNRFGTGYILPGIDTTAIQKPCPCPSCRTSQQPEMEYYEIRLFTAAHVVFNDEEAVDTEVELYYDSEDREGVKCLHAISARSSSYCDYSFVKCVTHDEKLTKTLRTGGIPYYTSIEIPHNLKALMISHPHGGSKHVSVGSFKHRSFRCQDQNTLTVRMPPRPPCISQEPVPGAIEIPAPKLLDAGYRYYKLPGRSKVILPTSCHALKNSSKKKEFTFYKTPPGGSQIKLPGGELVDFPDEAEIDFSSLNLQYGYDINTCPGSSGAPILFLEEGRKRLMWYLCHCGAVGSTNISSLDDWGLLR